MSNAAQTMELSEEEARLVLALRQVQQDERSSTNLFLLILEHAHKYSRWLKNRGAGSTYSTFCDDYKFPASTSYNRKFVYETILRIRALVENELRDPAGG